MVLLITVGLAIAGAGVFYAYRGVTPKFMEDLQAPGNGRTAVKWIAIIGYAAKGVIRVVVGIVIIVAAATADPSKSSGLDGGLKTLDSQPYCVYLLAAVAAVRVDLRRFKEFIETRGSGTDA